MSDLTDELLDDDFDYDDYDITNEKEEALLQDEESRDSYRKKSSDVDEEDEEDILNLQIEDDFQDVEEKTVCDEETPEKETVKQNPKPNVKTVSKSPIEKSPISDGGVSKKPNNVLQQKPNNNKPLGPQNNRRGRGTGAGRGNFQNRSNFLKNNNQRGRRNGTVFVNPRYEGTVHVNENSARLAWDNDTQNNTSYIQPWVSQDQMLINNLVTGIASNFAQTSASLLLQPPVQNLYQQPPPGNFERQISFEPPPNLESSQPTYNNQNQVANRQLFPPTQQNVPPHQPYSSARGPPQFNNQMSTSGTNLDSNSYGAPYKNENFLHNRNRPMGTYNNNNNYSSANNAQNKKFNYLIPDGYQNRSQNYTNLKQPDYNNYGSGHYGQRNVNKYDTHKTWNENKNTNYYKQNQNTNTAKVNFSYNNYTQQNQFNRNFNKPNNNFVPQRNKFIPYKYIEEPNNKRPAPQESVPEHESPKKVIRVNENVKTSCETEQNTQASKQTNIDNEDEETRQYILKIEEQKKEREKILKIKEERRKQMIMERQRREQNLLLAGLPSTVQQNKSNQVNQLPPKNSANLQDGPVKTAGYVQKQFSVPDSGPTQYSQRSDQYGVSSDSAVQNQYSGDYDQRSNQSGVQNQYSGGYNRRSNQSGVQNQYSQGHAQKPNQYPKASQPQRQINFQQKPKQYPALSSNFQQNPDDLNSTSNLDLAIRVPNLTFKGSHDHRENAPLASAIKSESSSGGFMSNRVVVVKSKNDGVSKNQTVGNEATNESSDVGQGHSSFFNNRKVLKKDDSLPNTRLVVVNNLSTTVNQNKLMTLARGIGEIQTLRVDKQERQATILFKTVACAHAFFKKHQRRILDDLSVIEVKLEPMI